MDYEYFQQRIVVSLNGTMAVGPEAHTQMWCYCPSVTGAVGVMERHPP